MAAEGIIFDIKHFALHDGPGIRTAVFLKGCPLRCAWCHNPESQSSVPEIMYQAEKCTGCRRCASVCPQAAHSFINGEHHLNREVCCGCGVCARRCPAGALQAAGRKVSPEEVLAEVVRDKIFYETSGGGLTVSGGEPLSQGEFTLALVRGAQAAGVRACIETCGCGALQTLTALCPYVETFYFDIKAADEEKHRRLTGTDNRLILSNLRALAAAGADIILRCPLVPGINDGENDLRGIQEIADGLPSVREIQIAPYHPLGMEKYSRLGRTPGIVLPEFAAEETAGRWYDYLTACARTPVSFS